MSSIESTSSVQSLRSTRSEDFDLVILGGGTGSTVAAWTFAAEGKRVAVIDRKYIGGSCPNIACLPSKNIIHSAKIASYLRNSDEFGIAMDGFSLDMSAVRSRKRKMVSGLNEMYLENYNNTGAELIFGTGRFIAPRTIEVKLRDGSVRQLRGTNVIISTGTHATLPPISGLVEARPLTHIEALELDRVPEHLLVVGGGYVGIELSQAMRRFGSNVSVLDANDRLLPREDGDVCDALRRLLQDDGIEVVLNVHPTRISGRSGETVQVVVDQHGADKTFAGTHLLVAAGRTPNTEGLGLEAAGVELTDRGYIRVNDRLQTTSPGVWAIGEVAGSPQFTHISVDDFRVVHSALTGGRRTTAGRQVPYCLFTDPELARIGLNEREAKAGNVAYRLFKVSMEANLRARTLGETRGFMKALVEEDGEQILGFTALGAGAGEIMAAVQVAMIAGLPYTALRDAVLTHPTLVEGLIPLFSSAATIHKAEDATASPAA
jgi:pyruvate/2-oxoglutarate dehydrogenase complex dihydrolipoamide dehydrogenase (E3) component